MGGCVLASFSEKFRIRQTTDSQWWITWKQKPISVNPTWYSSWSYEWEDVEICTIYSILWNNREIYILRLSETRKSLLLKVDNKNVFNIKP